MAQPKTQISTCLQRQQQHQPNTYYVVRSTPSHLTCNQLTHHIRKTTPSHRSSNPNHHLSPPKATTPLLTSPPTHQKCQHAPPPGRKCPPKIPQTKRRHQTPALLFPRMSHAPFLSLPPSPTPTPTQKYHMQTKTNKTSTQPTTYTHTQPT